MKNNERILFLKPSYVSAIWGDGSIARRYPSCIGVGVDTSNIAIIGAFAIAPEFSNEIVGGVHDGEKLYDLFKSQPELFGSLKPTWEHPAISMGIGHACEDLSIQVHPREEYAMKHENTHGKSECWYIVDVDQEPADVILGHTAQTLEEFKQLAEAERFDELFLRSPVEKGSFFNLLAGTLHSLQKGTTFIEVCSASNLTYRLYDYHRKDTDGKERPLQKEKFYDNVLIPYEEMSYTTVLSDYDGVNERLLTDNENFSTRLLTCKNKGTVPMKKPYYACFVIEGEGSIDGQPLNEGDCFVLTSAVEEFTLEGNVKILAAHG